MTRANDFLFSPETEAELGFMNSFHEHLIH